MKTFFPVRYCFFFLLLPAFAALPAKAVEPWQLVLTESEWIAPNIIRIPFTLTGTLVTVRARVDTLEGNFFFDTGASGLVLNHRHFAGQAGRVAHAGGGVTGQVRVMGSSKVDTFQMDNLQVADLRAGCIDLSHIELTKKIDLVGLIGYEVFQGYEVLFDYGASMLMLVRTDARGNPMEDVPKWEYQPLRQFPLKVSGHVAILRLGFGGKTVREFALDSGAEQNLLSNATGKRFLKENFEIHRRFKLRGAGRAEVEVLGGLLLNAGLDSLTLKPMATLLTNLTEINGVYETQVDGILGYEFLSQRPVSINYRKKLLTFYTSVRP